jgi:hypothetical protein
MLLHSPMRWQSSRCRQGTHTQRPVLGDFESKVIGPELDSASITITVRP